MCASSSHNEMKATEKSVEMAKKQKRKKNPVH